MNFLVDKEGYYGEFGGAYVPEILHKCVEELQNTYLKVLQSEDFKREYDQLLRDYVGRPSPLYLAHRLSLWPRAFSLISRSRITSFIRRRESSVS